MTPRQLELLKFFHGYAHRHGGVAATQREAMEALGTNSHSFIAHAVSALQAKGYVRVVLGRTRNIEVLRMPEGAA